LRPGGSDDANAHSWIEPGSRVFQRPSADGNAEEAEFASANCDPEVVDPARIDATFCLKTHYLAGGNNEFIRAKGEVVLLLGRDPQAGHSVAVWPGPIAVASGYLL
jgi:hypothetical protein